MTGSCVFEYLPENIHDMIKRDYEYFGSNERKNMQFYCLSKGRFVNLCMHVVSNVKIVDLYDISWGMGGHTMVKFNTETLEYSYSGLRNVGEKGCEEFTYSSKDWSDMYKHIVAYLKDHIPKKDYDEKSYNGVWSLLVPRAPNSSFYGVLKSFYSLCFSILKQ